MARTVTKTRHGEPLLTLWTYEGRENVLCMETTVVGGMGGAIVIHTPVADEAEAVKTMRFMAHANEMGAVNFAKWKLEREQPSAEESDSTSASEIGSAERVGRSGNSCRDNMQKAS